jgi:primary-amine oxidase
MPAEPMTLLLRPRNFFIKNPALDVPPSYCSTPSQVKSKAKVLDAADKFSTLVIAGGEAECGKKG